MNMTPNPGTRIIVVGTSGSGKTTFADRLAEVLRVPHIELDAIFWKENWQESELDEFRSKVEEVVCADGWVMEGNYRKVRDLTWGRAQTLVWLDYSLPVILWRLTRRTMRRVFRRELLWGKNRETFRGAFLDRDSLFLYVLSSRPKQRKTYPELLKTAQFAHLNVVHLRTPRAAERWLEEVRKAAAGQ